MPAPKYQASLPSPSEELLLFHPTVELPSFLIQSQPQLP